MNQLAKRSFMIALLFTGIIVQAQSKKFAVLVGIDAYKENALVGCKKDATNIRDLLINRCDFPLSNISLLLNQKATRKGIIDLIKTKQLQARRGDLFVFYFSGHGTRFPDEKSEEWDELKPGQLVSPNVQNESLRKMLNIGLDSALCPVDVGGPKASGKPWENLILDDELYLLFLPFVQKGCGVIVIVDSCHSGTIIMRKIGGDDAPQRLVKELALNRALTKRFAEIPKPQVVRSVRDHYASGLYLAITSSTDLQESGATANGSLFTNALIKAVKSNSRLTYLDLYRTVKTIVWDQSSQAQKPQLDQRFYRGNLQGLFLALPRFLPQEFVPAPLQARLRVTDQQEKPLMGANISITSLANPSLSSSGSTDQRGRYVSQNVLPHGEFRLNVSLPNYQTIETSLELVDFIVNSGWAEYWVRMTRNRIIRPRRTETIEGIKVYTRIKRPDTVKVIRPTRQ